MARTSDLTPAQMKVARQLRSLRLQLGMGVPRFGKLIGMDSTGVTHRELFRVPWKESELQTALPALVNHLKASLQYAASIASAFTTNEENEITINTQKP